MTINHKPITNQEQYIKVAYRLEQLKNAEPATAEAIELRLMTQLIVEYEVKKVGRGQKELKTYFKQSESLNRNSYQ